MASRCDVGWQCVALKRGVTKKTPGELLLIAGNHHSVSIAERQWAGLGLWRIRSEVDDERRAKIELLRIETWRIVNGEFVII